MDGGFPAFCQSNLPLIYGIYGLAFFVTGVAVALESGRNSQLALARALPFLAAFGLTHGLNEWIEMFMLMSSETGESFAAARVVSLVLLVFSFVLLIQFAVRLMGLLEPERYVGMGHLPFVLTAAYLAALAIVWFGVAKGDVVFFGRTADILSRYILGFTGALLACAAMFVQRRAFIREGYAQFSRDLIGAALAFAWYAFTQLVVPSGDFFPASALNTTTFVNWTGIPVQLVRAGVVAVLAFFIIRVMRVFETEYARRIEQLNQERFDAQDRAARELTALFETCRILGASLDLNVVLNEAIEKIVTLVEPVTGGTVYLYDEGERALVAQATYRRPEVPQPPDFGERARTIARRAFELRDLAYEAGKEPPAFIGLPLLSGDKPIGALALAQGGAFSNLAVLQTLARQLVIAIENARLYQRVQEKEELRGKLLERVVAAQEEERKRLARDLHDQTGQTLTGLAMGLRSVEALVQTNPQLAQQRLYELEEMSAAAMDDLRQMISDLRPAQLDDLGLVAALREMGKNVEAHSQLKVEVNVRGSRRRLRPEAETILYRIAQEALTNAARHSHATVATVDLVFDMGVVQLVVSDNGIGFVPEAVMRKDTTRRPWGLLGMQERAELAGGEFRIESAPGKGARVIVTVPLGEVTA